MVTTGGDSRSLGGLSPSPPQAVSINSRIAATETESPDSLRCFIYMLSLITTIRATGDGRPYRPNRTHSLAKRSVILCNYKNVYLFIVAPLRRNGSLFTNIGRRISDYLVFLRKCLTRGSVFPVEYLAFCNYKKVYLFIVGFDLQTRKNRISTGEFEYFRQPPKTPDSALRSLDNVSFSLFSTKNKPTSPKCLEKKGI